jgi:hypothetical protein
MHKITTNQQLEEGKWKTKWKRREEEWGHLYNCTKLVRTEYVNLLQLYGIAWYMGHKEQSSLVSKTCNICLDSGIKTINVSKEYISSFHHQINATIVNCFGK